MEDARDSKIRSTPLPTEPGWYWFKGRMFVGKHEESEEFLPVRVRGPNAIGQMIVLMNGHFATDYMPLVGEFRKAPNPFDE